MRGKVKGNCGEQGTGYIENQDFDFGEQGNEAIYFRETKEQIPTTLGAPQYFLLICHI